MHRNRKVDDLGEPETGFLRKSIIQHLTENKKRGLNLFELEEYTGADLLSLMEVIKQLQTEHIVNCRVLHAKLWCYLLWEVA